MASGCLALSPHAKGAVGQQGSQSGGTRSPIRKIARRRGAAKAQRDMTDRAQGSTIHYRQGMRPQDTLQTGYEALGCTMDGVGSNRIYY